MNKGLSVTAIAAVLACCALAGVRAQDTPPTSVISASNAFSQIQPDMQGTVTQPVTHTATGDVIAAYIGHAPRQVYTKQDELIYVLSGHGTAAIGYPSYDVGPGSVISIPRNTSFEITASGAAPIKAIIVASPADNPADRKVLTP